jgi:FkbM family methyltransferase
MTFRQLARLTLPPVITAAIDRAQRRAADPERYARDAELKRLSALAPGQPATTTLFGFPFEITDGRSFVGLYNTFFRRQINRFSAAGPRPRIIDCGANIGVSVAWWKSAFPEADITAFEADPEIFAVLERNCAHWPNVTAINAAVWDRDGQVSFRAKGGEGGHLSHFSQASQAALVTVPCVRLRSFLAQPCSFLKIDIEGAEIDVIRDCADAFGLVERLFVEYHSFTSRPQRLAETIACLEGAGFRLHVHVEMPSPQPFEELLELNEKDLRLDLFCFREPTAPAVRKIS